MFIELTEVQDNLKIAIPIKHIREVQQLEDGICCIVGKYDDYEVKESYDTIMKLLRK